MADEDEELVDVFVGRVLDGRYRLTERLGAGGMGAVYAAEHEPFGRPVAVKILHPQLTMNSDVMRRFKNEARASGTLGHPHIARALDFGRTDEGAPYIAMEYLDGIDLGEHLAREGPLPVDRAVAIADQMADGLAAAHAEDIVHRDVKPENVFVCKGEHVKILDFGISKFSQDNSSVTTKTGAFMGSPYYMAPEQVADASRADARTDVYALGAVLYRMLSGETVFPPDALPMLIVAIANDPPRPLTELRRDVPVGLSDLVASMLAKDPADRPQSMHEVRAALDAYKRIDSAPILLVPKTSTPPAAVENASRVRSRVELPTTRWPALLGAGVALAIGAAGIAAVALSSSDEPPPSPSPEPAANEPAPPAPAPSPAAVAEPEATVPDGVEAPADPELEEPPATPTPARPSASESDERGATREPVERARPPRRPAAEPEPPPARPTTIGGVPMDDSY